MNETIQRDRYPGARPFTDTAHDRHLFFGRDQELNDLLHQLLSVNLLVLFGKSGLGKTSLLQAGLFPRLRERDLLPLPVRLNRPELAPMTVLTEAIRETCTAVGIDYTPGETTGLWEFFKTAVFWRGDSLQTPVLVLDQFEEIFTLQRVDNRRWLARELGDLSGGRLPQRVRERLLAGEKLPYSDKPPSVKIILSLREDYLGALQELTAAAPQILDHRFRLTPMDRSQARLAVVEPARLEAAEFSTQPFAYDDNAIEEMLAFLGGKFGEIEPFQLQVLCRQIEQKVQHEQAEGKQNIRVDRAYLGGRQAMEKILQNFYLDAIGHLPKRRLRNRARLLCEEGLLSPEGHRVSLVERHIKEMYGLPPSALQILVDTRLLRKEERLESHYYELSHDSLTQPVLNSRRWRMPRGLKIGLGIAGVILLLSGGGFLWIWDTQLREHVEYYNTSIKRWGHPVGIGPLTSEQVKHRAVSLKFIRYGRYHPVERVVAVNSQGECTSQNTVETYFKPSLGFTLIEPLLECQWEFVYDSQEQIVYEKAYNRFAKMVWGFIYSPSTSNEEKRGHYVGPDGFPRPQLNSSAEFVELKYSPQGDEILTLYFDRYHHPQPGRDKAFGRRQQFYPNGLLKQLTSLDSAGQPMNDKVGNASQKIIRDELGNVVEAIMLDVDGQPVLVKDNYHKLTARHDEYGNEIEQTFFDTAGRPTLVNQGFHKQITKYDEYGNRVEQAYYDTVGKPISPQTTVSIRLDIAGQPLQLKVGFHKQTAKYDEHGRLIELAFFDTTGQPTLMQGVHKTQIKYDERGYPVEQWFSDIVGQPTLNKLGAHKINTKFDESGKPVNIMFFDIAGQPTLVQNGYHRLTAKYDERGNRIEESYFNATDQPTLHKDGFHRFTAKYDDRGNRIEEAYFDTTGQPILYKDGYHLLKVMHDDRGNRIEEAYFDTAGQPILVKNGFHLFKAKYDGRGNRIEETYSDTAGQPTLHKDGYHRFTAKYDDRDNRIEVAYFDTAGQPILYKGGYHLFKAKYDERGNRIERAFFDTTDQPIFLNNEFHRIVNKYDEHGNLIEESYFDTAGQPMLDNDGTHLVKIKYDDHGNQVEQAYFDTAGQPILHKDGYHRSTAKYDERGNRIEQAVFDTTGQPTLHKDGFHWATTKYDEHDNQLEEAYFDTAGKPILLKSGYHLFKTKYDERGNLIEQACYGITGDLVLSNKGFKRLVRRYYPNGQKSEEITYGFEPQWGYERRVVSFDEKGNPIKLAYFDINDQPVETEILVTEVSPDSRAEKMGIQVGDVFTRYDSKPVTDSLHFREDEPADGPPKELLVRRNGEILSFQLSPGKIGVRLQDRGITPVATHPTASK